jgi:serine/threonine protein kinase
MTDPAATGATGATGAPAAPLGEELLAGVRRALAADYDVEREVGRGGMAVVFKAREKELERTVALKVLPPDLAPVATVADRFKREARLAASLDHPNIIPVYRVGQTGGVLYMAMKYIDGRALDGLVASQGPLPLPVVLTVLRAAARAIAYAHEHGIVHRDIKGANILIDRNGRVVVSDFGIARAMESATLTATGLMIGTPHYMSPEQCAGKTVGAQSDQYSLGIVAYQLLTGVVPFDAESLPEILQQHCFTPPPDASVARPDSPAVLTAIVQRLLAKEPANRFASTNDLVVALDSIPFTESERTAGESALKALVRARSSLPPVPQHSMESAIAERVSDPRTLRTPVPGESGARALAVSDPAETAHASGPSGTRPIASVPTRQLSESEMNGGAVTARPITVEPDAPVAPRAHAVGALAPQARSASRAATQSATRAATRHRASKPVAGASGARGKPWRVPAVAAVFVAACLVAGFAVAKRHATIGASGRPARPDALALRQYGHRAYQSGDYELARRFYVRAVRLDSANRDAQEDLGCALLKLGGPDSARSHFLLAHRERPTACTP